MKKNLKIIVTAFIFFVFLAPAWNAQTCGTGQYNVTGPNNSTYTVNTGETLSIDSAGVYTGTVYLNGGVICNKGIFRPQSFTFLAGTLTNHSSVNLNASLALTSVNTLACEKKSFIRIAGDLSLDGGTFTNHGVANITSDIQITSGSLTNSGIINCTVLSGVTSGIVNSGLINKN